MNYDDNYEDEAFQTLRHFALVGLRNLKIQNRLIISYIISTIFPLLFVYLYSYYLYGRSVVTGSAAGSVDPDRRHCTDHDHLHLPQYFQSDSAYDRDLSEYL